MNRLKKLLDNNEIFANAGLIASTICIIYVIPINKEYSVSFFILLWFFLSTETLLSLIYIDPKKPGLPNPLIINPSFNRIDFIFFKILIKALVEYYFF